MYAAQFNKFDTLSAQMLSGATTGTLTSGNFGSPTGVQCLVLDYDVPAKVEVVECTIAGTALTAMTRGLDGTSAVQHEIGCKVLMGFVPRIFDTVKQYDGWIPAMETWTYASATTFTITGDQTGHLNVGDRLMLTNTTLKYFYLQSTSFGAGVTTVTVNGGTDYTLASAAITGAYYSKTISPNGFPQWFVYSASASGWAATPTVKSKFSMVGRSVTLHVDITGTSNATSASANLPINAGSYADTNGVFRAVDNGVALTTAGQAYIAASASTVSFFKDMTSGNWTNPGTKSVGGLAVTYEI